MGIKGRMALRRVTNFAGSPARLFDNQRDDGPKLDTSGKPEPPADKASRGREMEKGLWNVNLNQGSSVNYPGLKAEA